MTSVWAKAIFINSIIETARKIVDRADNAGELESVAEYIEMNNLLIKWDELYAASKPNTVN